MSADANSLVIDLDLLSVDGAERRTLDVARTLLLTQAARIAKLEARERALFGPKDSCGRCAMCGITPEVVAERVSEAHEYGSKADRDRVVELEEERKKCMDLSDEREGTAKTPHEALSGALLALESQMSRAARVEARLAVLEQLQRRSW